MKGINNALSLALQPIAAQAAQIAADIDARATALAKETQTEKGFVIAALRHVVKTTPGGISDAFEIVESLYREARAQSRSFVICYTTPSGAIQHLVCGAISHNPNDVENRYCARCHQFLTDAAPMDGGRAA